MQEQSGGFMTGYVEDKKRVITRLRRIEGQVRAIEKMVENDTYCIDVLTQIAASSSALKSVALNILDDHMNHCVRQAAAKGGDEADEKMQEASEAIARLVRS
ncbi:transcriptional regulator [Bombiscardovia apis]|uniref:Transcriptional regulator n=2 Tax=Bombiscardovia apis TaxID=2932182 RepID=A0ABN6SFC7_9BIFI|nr:transcriptional regulator [Bombiscardovia apis]